MSSFTIINLPPFKQRQEIFSPSLTAWERKGFENVKHMDALTIADRIGHEAIDITYTYARLFPNVQNKLAKEMDKDV